MATTRRPQINHRKCDHPATPKARKACRTAWRKAEREVNDFTTEPSEKLMAMRTKLERHPSAAARLLVISIDAELAARTAPKPNHFRSAASGLTHDLAELADGTLVPRCSLRITKGQAEHRDGWDWRHATCNKCNGIAANNQVGR